jgi:hypothetical protein
MSGCHFGSHAPRVPQLAIAGSGDLFEAIEYAEGFVFYRMAGAL